MRHSLAAHIIGFGTLFGILIGTFFFFFRPFSPPFLSPSLVSAPPLTHPFFTSSSLFFYHPDSPALFFASLDAQPRFTRIASLPLVPKNIIWSPAGNGAVLQHPEATILLRFDDLHNPLSLPTSSTSIVWSYDGQRIAYQDLPETFVYETPLHVVDVASGHDTVLAHIDNSANSHTGGVLFLSWLPDNEHLMYAPEVSDSSAPDWRVLHATTGLLVQTDSIVPTYHSLVYAPDTQHAFGVSSLYESFILNPIDVLSLETATHQSPGLSTGQHFCQWTAQSALSCLSPRGSQAVQLDVIESPYEKKTSVGLISGLPSEQVVSFSLTPNHDTLLYITDDSRLYAASL